VTASWKKGYRFGPVENIQITRVLLGKPSFAEGQSKKLVSVNTCTITLANNIVLQTEEKEKINPGPPEEQGESGHVHPEITIENWMGELSNFIGYLSLDRKTWYELNAGSESDGMNLETRFSIKKLGKTEEEVFVESLYRSH
jgi:hypothetical protein